MANINAPLKTKRIAVDAGRKAAKIAAQAIETTNPRSAARIMARRARLATTAERSVLPPMFSQGV